MRMNDEAILLNLPEGDQIILKEIWRKKLTLLEEIAKLQQELQDVDREIDLTEETDESSKANSRGKQMQGRKKFNMDPKKGVEYLIENDLVQQDAKDIAKFLYKGEGLNKTAIGNYLGEKNEFNLSVLNEFVTLHQFTDMELDTALRQFLWNFRLPGEAQKIDRMMEAFALHYCNCNPEVFSNSDTCYVLSFAIIMLNTSLHNPSVKEKPAVDRFISMNRGINDGKDLPEELLTNLYESIKKVPFKIPEDDDNNLAATFFNPDKEGWLLKQGGGRYKTWKRRWFLLNENCLYYFEYTTDREPKGIIPLENLQIREVNDPKKPHCFELYLPEQGSTQTIKAAKTDSDGRLIQGKHITYRMSASSAEAKEDWITYIRKSVSQDPYYDMIAARKRKAVQNPKNG